MWRKVIIVFLLLQFGKAEKFELPIFTEKGECPPGLESKCSCLWNPVRLEFLTDCSNANLSSIPVNIANVTTHLLLNDNGFGVVKNGSFANLHELVWLEISSSQLYRIEADAFEGLRSLGVLILKDNRLSAKNGSYPGGLFKQLTQKLKILDIRGNLRNLPLDLRTYPDEALSYLECLEVLRLDCISDFSLSHGFSKMTHLRVLDFSEGTPALNIPDDMFNEVSKLKIGVVNFTNVNIGRIHGKVFSVLKSLKVLDLTNNPSLRNTTVDIAAALRETSIEELYLNNTCLGVTGSTDQLMQNLRGTNLKVISLDWDEIAMIDAVFSRNVPLLEVLTLRHNRLYEHFELIRDIMKLKHLRILDISYQNTNSPSFCQNHINDTEYTTNLHKMRLYQKKRQLLSKKKKFCLEQEACPIQFPPSLEWAAASHNGVHFTQVPELVFMNNGTLKYVDVSNNGIQNILKPGYCARGVYSTVEYLDISNCGIQCVNKTFATHCEYSLKHLNLSRNKLGLHQGECNKDPQKDFLSFVKPVHTLLSLDISSNYISFLFNDSFHGLDNLRKLMISNNKLSSWVTNITHFLHIELIDISYNNLASLSEATTLTLDRLEKNNLHNRTTQHISLDLVGNPISCSCENLRFLSWLLRTKLILINRSKYRCVYKDGSEISMSNGLEKIVTDLETSCANNLWLILSISGVLIHFITVAALTTLYRFRHYIKYVVLKMRMRRERLEAFLGREKLYKYDAFVSCTREGAKWVKRHLLPRLETGDEETGLTFCVAQRDFVVGGTIIDNIIRSINSSRHTILLLDRTFVESGWCNEELLISHNESLSRGYNMIICIFMPEMDIHERHLPPRINMLRRQVTCIKWSHDPAAQRVFWLLLGKALRRRKPKDVFEY